MSTITLEQALELVSFRETVPGSGSFAVDHVLGIVLGDVHGSVLGHVRGSVYGTIQGRPWEFFETPKEKLRRLIEEGADKEQLIEALNQLEDS